jgi:hypothetical protein
MTEDNRIYPSDMVDYLVEGNDVRSLAEMYLEAIAGLPITSPNFHKAPKVRALEKEILEAEEDPAAMSFKSRKDSR